ncbi:MAG: polysaccharide biosynthesis protein [Cellvibrionaceae bacterium]|nr:polysaccharide biosynthesis protein [Cellvibrionaceae bacterium]
MKRTHKRLIMVCADLLALPLALWSGYALRLSTWWPEAHLLVSWWLFLLVPFVGVYIFACLGLYRAVVRFMSVQAIWAVTRGVFLLALFLWTLAFIFTIEPFPRSIPINFALVALVYVGGSRLLVRHYYHWLLKHYVNKDAVLIYGAGGAAIQLATALSDGREYYPVGFVDDDKSLWGATIKGLPVHSPYEINNLVQFSGIKHVLLAVPQASNRQRKQMLERLEGINVHVQTIPSMPELLSGEASIEQLREVLIEELLGRDPVPPMPSLMAKCIEQQVVMITGAGGSIGSELCRQVIKQKPKAILLFEASEYALYQIEQELQKLMQEQHFVVPLLALLGSVVDRNRIQSVIRRFAVDTIYHAAAYKHVPMVEHNVVEGVTNNIFGTQVVAEAAADHDVNYFILVSTDKAVRPTNVMGATKRFSELILQHLATTETKTVFSMVRFGNVLGSSGSVVPLFRKQIRDGGPITVTHKDITRYFMTIPEAAALVIQAGSMAQGGDVFVLDMGESVKVVDLAKRMIQLSGLEVKSVDNPYGDIEIQYTGLRPAEKLYEELLVGDRVTGTEHGKIMRANEASLSASDLYHYLAQMRQACDSADANQLREILQKSVCGYQPHKESVDHILDDKLNESCKKVVKFR